MIYQLIHTTFLVLFAYLFAGCLYLLVCAVAGRWGRKRTDPNPRPTKKRVAVLIPCYREDAIILDTVQRALIHDYPASCYQIVVIADSMQAGTVQQLRKLPITVLEVAFSTSTKARSLHAALTQLPDCQYDIVLILDADNVMQAGCLEKISAAFYRGCRAVQCHRIAKNTDQPVALLEAVSEEINTNIFRRGQAALRLSAAPAGSGMAFEMDLFKTVFSDPRILDSMAEDREIDMQLMMQGIHMDFIDDAYVLDEKVSNARVFENQRTRWFEAQLTHVRRLLEGPMRRSKYRMLYYNQLLRNLLLPRLFYLVLMVVIGSMLGLQAITGIPILYPATGWWIAWEGMVGTIFFISIPRRFFTKQTARAVGWVPVLALAALKSLLKLRRNRKEFLHTSKSVLMDDKNSS